MRGEKYDEEVELGEIPTPFPADIPESVNDTATLLQQTSPDPVLIQIENKLRGNVWDPLKYEWVKKYDPIMNNTGINKIMILLTGIVNTNCLYSNLTKNNVSTISLAIANSITLDICSNYKEYELSKSDFDRVVEMIAFMCFFALKRSYLEGERHFLKTAYKSHETIVQKPSQETSGRWIPFGNRVKK